MLTIEDLQEGDNGWELNFPGVPKYNPATFWGELSAFLVLRESLRGVQLSPWEGGGGAALGRLTAPAGTAAVLKCQLIPEQGPSSELLICLVSEASC